VRHAEDRPLAARDVKTLRELPSYWQMMANSRASKTLMNARIRAMVFLAQNLELRIEALKKRIGQLKYENDVLHEEIALLRRRNLVLSRPHSTKRSGPRVSSLGPQEPTMSGYDSTRVSRLYNAVVGPALRGKR
jgi:hypothetical protein